jgi:hypothetical protein
MEILQYKNLEIKPVKKQFEKTLAFLKAGDFKSADVKKMQNTGLYRAKLDDTNRLLFQIGKYNQTTYLLLLEVILNHDYNSSRFLNGAPIIESNLEKVDSLAHIQESDFKTLPYVNAKKKEFYFLDKILSFDDIQEEIVHLNPPSIIIGSAGSGKTAITLEKLKTLPGRILYVTLSSYLSENSANLYSSFNFQNNSQEVDFFSYHEYLNSFQVVQGKELIFKTFDFWANKFRQQTKINDSFKLFEEFKGVITGVSTEKAYLTRQEYLDLGIKQSIFTIDDRSKVYDLFLKYLDWMKEEHFFDANIQSFQLLSKIEPIYDYVLIDEVQDLTNIQLYTILKSLKEPKNFILCGDSNQIVHPNFFSWAQIKTLFYTQDINADIIKILATNYRNTNEVTQIANQLLMVKNARFGSIDKESTYLVQSNSKHKGVVEFLENTQKNNADINSKTQNSTKFAVLVLRNEDKSEAKKYFKTPLLFSVQEAKGLEYENIILFNIISDNEKVFRDLCEGVEAEDLKEENFKYSRNKNKADKSLDEYKFYINSFYVGITRAIQNLYVVEKNKKHELLSLLNLTDFKQSTSLQNQKSSLEDWAKEASRLAKQGKLEQAEAIANQILKLEKPPYTPFDLEQLEKIIPLALDENAFNKKSKDKLYDYALLNFDIYFIDKLASLKYTAADKWSTDGKSYLKRTYNEYATDNLKLLLPKITKYGINYRNEQNFTPFMMACYFGAEKIADYLVENGADMDAKDLSYRNALQIAIMHGSFNPPNKLKILEVACKYLKNTNISLKIDDKLVKISIHQGEYWLLQYFIAGAKAKHSLNLAKKNSIVFSAGDVTYFVNELPANAIPEFRKKQTYISSLLSKNEVNGKDMYNKKLFLRLKMGFYILNPNIEFLIKDEWISMREFLGLAHYEIAQKEALFTHLY